MPPQWLRKKARRQKSEHNDVALRRLHGDPSVALAPPSRDPGALTPAFDV